MKLLTISVAAYNVEKFLHQTLESFLIKEELLSKIEVVVVSDGSTDKTVEIANEFSRRYPGIFVVIDKENGGYGSTINSSLKIAKGKYFKTVDGDDWVDKNGLEKLVECLETCDTDLVISKFSTVSDVDGSVNLITNSLIYDNASMPFDEMLRSEKPDFLSMHGLTFRTDLLRKHNIVITEKCFYTDAELVMKPIPFIETVKIIDANVYMYRVGREGQSVSLKSRMKHMDQAIRVNLEKCNFAEQLIKSKSLSREKKEYLLTAILFDLGIQYYFLLAFPKKDALEKLSDFDNQVHEKSDHMYNLISKSKYGAIIIELRRNGFKRMGVKPYLHHIKLRMIDLKR